MRPTLLQFENGQLFRLFFLTGENRFADLMFEVVFAAIGELFDCIAWSGKIAEARAITFPAEDQCMTRNGWKGPQRIDLSQTG